MSIITLQPQLMEQVEQVAAEQAVMPSELLEAALGMVQNKLHKGENTFTLRVAGQSHWPSKQGFKTLFNPRPTRLGSYP